MQQSKCLGALHGHHGVFPDTDLRVIDEAGILECADQITTEVAQADESLPHLRGRQIHAVEADIAPRLDDAKELGDQEAQLGHELRIVAAVAHVVVAVGVHEQIRERWREHRVVDAVVSHAPSPLHAVAKMHGEPVAFVRVLAVLIHDVLLACQFLVHDVLHVLDHVCAHFMVLDLLALEVGQDLAFVLGGEQMHQHAPRLPEPMASAHGLVELLERVIQAHERHARTVLPVHAEAADLGLADEHAHLAMRKREHLLRLVFGSVRALHVDCARNQRCQQLGLVVQMAPDQPWFGGVSVHYLGQRVAPRLNALPLGLAALSQCLRGPRK